MSQEASNGPRPTIGGCVALPPRSACKASLSAGSSLYFLLLKRQMSVAIAALTATILKACARGLEIACRLLPTANAIGAVFLTLIALTLGCQRVRQLSRV